MASDEIPTAVIYAPRRDAACELNDVRRVHDPAAAVEVVRGGSTRGSRRASSAGALCAITRNSGDLPVYVEREPWRRGSASASSNRLAPGSGSCASARTA